MTFTLPELPYNRAALEPYISENTIDFHYGKHHQTYVDNLNKLVVGSDFENSTLEEIILKAESGIFNNAAQIWNHSFYWKCLKPNGGGEPTGALADAIKSSFGTFDEFKQKFSTASVTLFGSGWAWLVKDAQGKLQIIQESNAGNPLKKGLKPLLTCDVWEHAYYLDKQNKRPAYVGDFWKIINWNFVSENLK